MKKMSSFKNAQAGVSLVELMIGLTIGLIITGGAMTLLFSNQQMLLGKESLDRTQEGFRFATTTITRMVRQASSFDKPTSNNELIINFDSTQRDCLGQVNNSTTNTLKLDSNNQLVCILNKDPTQTYVLAKNVGGLEFSYGIQSSGAVAYSPYYSSGATVNSSVNSVWNNISSVQTRISIIQQGNTNQPTLDFIATSHNIGMTKSLSSGGTSTASNSSTGSNGSGSSGSGSNGSNGSGSSGSSGSGSNGSNGSGSNGSNGSGSNGSNGSGSTTVPTLSDILSLLTVTYSGSSIPVPWSTLALSTVTSPEIVAKGSSITVTLTNTSNLDVSGWSLVSDGTTISLQTKTITVTNANNSTFSIQVKNSAGTQTSTINFKTSNK